MRILVVSLNFAPEETATGFYTGAFAKWLASNGHSVDAIAGLPHYPEWRVREEYAGKGLWKEAMSGVNVFRTPHTVPSGSAVSARHRILMEVSFSVASLPWWVRILFARRRYDAVISVCPPMQTAVMPWLYGVLRRVPWIFHVQDFQVDAALRLDMLKLGGAGKLLYRIENFLLRRATVVPSITPAMCRRAVEKGGDLDNCWHVPNWADVHGITPGERDNAFRRELGVTSDQVLVIYAGAIATKQGLDVVLDAADSVRSDARYQFVLVGNGSDRQRLEARAAEMKLPNLRFLDLQPRERLSEMLNTADIHLVV